MSLERPEISKRDCGAQKSEKRCDKFTTQLPDGALDDHRLLTCDNTFIMYHRSLSLQSAPVRTALCFMGKHSVVAGISITDITRPHTKCSSSLCRCQAYLQSPEWIRGVWVSVEEPCGLGSCTQQIFGRQTLCLRDVPYLRHTGQKKVHITSMNKLYVAFNDGKRGVGVGVV